MPLFERRDSGGFSVCLERTRAKNLRDGAARRSACADCDEGPLWFMLMGSWGVRETRIRTEASSRERSQTSSRFVLGRRSESRGLSPRRSLPAAPVRELPLVALWRRSEWTGRATASSRGAALRLTPASSMRSKTRSLKWKTSSTYTGSLPVKPAAKSFASFGSAIKEESAGFA